MKMTRWTREQTLVALNLYCQLPFGRFHQHNPLIIDMAAKIDRTPSALAMKLSNLASLDSSFRASGRVGLEGASSLDKEIWEEFQKNPERMGEESQRIVDDLVVGDAHLGELSSERLPEAKLDDYFSDSPEVVVRVRRKQGFFRKAVLSSYETRCCMSGVADSRLLIASHIVPWATAPESRLNPANGLCLSVLHDRAYDQGLITVTTSFQVKVSDTLKESFDNPMVRDCLIGIDGRKIMLPRKFVPNPDFLEYHEKNIFLR